MVGLQRFQRPALPEMNRIAYLYSILQKNIFMTRIFNLAILLCLLSASTAFAQKKDRPEPVPLTFKMLESCLYLGPDTVEKILATAGYLPVQPSDKQVELLKDKWKPNRTILLGKGNVEIVVVFSTSHVFHLTVRSESSKDKTGENLFIESFKSGYKEITHDGDNPRAAKNGPKKEVKYDTNNKPWLLDLNGKI
jgi:hypothetical protein